MKGAFTKIEKLNIYPSMIINADIKAENRIPVIYHDIQNALLVQPNANKPFLKLNIFSLINSS
jgi:hypothetical protein